MGRISTGFDTDKVFYAVAYYALYNYPGNEEKTQKIAEEVLSCFDPSNSEEFFKGRTSTEIALFYDGLDDINDEINNFTSPEAISKFQKIIKTTKAISSALLKMEIKLKKMVRALNLNSPNIAQEIRGLENELEKANKEGLITDQQLSSWKVVLGQLKNREFLSPNISEKLVDYFGKAIQEGGTFSKLSKLIGEIERDIEQEIENEVFRSVIDYWNCEGISLFDESSEEEKEIEIAKRVLTCFDPSSLEKFLKGRSYTDLGSFHRGLKELNEKIKDLVPPETIRDLQKILDATNKKKSTLVSMKIDFRRRVRDLDLNSPNVAQKIEALQAELETLHREGVINDQELSSWNFVLGNLKDRESLSPNISKNLVDYFKTATQKGAGFITLSEFIGRIEVRIKQEIEIEKRVKSIQENRQKLDVQNPNFKEDVLSLSREVKELRKIPNAPSLDNLEKTLDRLFNPEELKISRVGIEFMGSFEDLHPLEKPKVKGKILNSIKCKSLSIKRLKKNEKNRDKILSELFKDLEKGAIHTISDPLVRRYLEGEKESIQEAQKVLLSFLQEKGEDLEALESMLEEKLASFPKEVRESRVENFIGQQQFKEPLSQHTKKHLIRMYNEFEKLTTEVLEPKIQSSIESAKKELDEDYDGAYSKYREMISLDYFSKEIAMGPLQAKFMKLVSLGSCDRDTYNEFKQNIDEQIKSLYKETVEMGLIWFLENGSRITRVSDQSDIHTNLEEGVCYANSLRRAGQIMENPNITSEGIQMGSSRKTRIQQMRYRKEKTIIELNRMAKGIENGYKIKRVKSEYVQGTGDKEFAAQCIKKIDALFHKGETNMVFAIYLTNGGHAFNIQLDQASQKYRIFDDNCGVIEFGDYETFKTEFEKYIGTVYMRYNDSVEINCYGPLEQTTLKLPVCQD